VANRLGTIRRYVERRERWTIPPRAGWRGSMLAVTAAVMVMLAASAVVLLAPATRAGRARLVRPVISHPSRGWDAVSATPRPEPPLPPPRPPGVANVHSRTLPPVYFRVPTAKPVVFLTIDDGWTPSRPALKLIRDHHLPVTAFLIDQAWRRDPAYFRALRAEGVAIEDHTLTHPVMSRLPLVRQEQEICGGATGEAAGFGARPTLFRPPYGVFDHATLQAAHACHLAAVIEWSATVDHGRLVVVGGRLRPGDIILMHFRASLPRDLTTALDAIRRAHLTVGRLPSYLESRTASQ
jgi:peptidoglycan/xylan/chitin deacetylase (PgdA/CDA1 family)